jgi:hypothetical protein
MTSAAQVQHARESLRLAALRGWDRARAIEHATQALVGQGVDRQAAEAVVVIVWRVMER